MNFATIFWLQNFSHDAINKPDISFFQFLLFWKNNHYKQKYWKNIKFNKLQNWKYVFFVVQEIFFEYFPQNQKTKNTLKAKKRQSRLLNRTINKKANKNLSANFNLWSNYFLFVNTLKYSIFHCVYFIIILKWNKISRYLVIIYWKRRNSSFDIKLEIYFLLFLVKNLKKNLFDKNRNQ